MHPEDRPKQGLTGMFIEMGEREDAARRIRIKGRDLPGILRSIRTPTPMKRGEEARPDNSPPRGVYECEIAQSGHRAFHIVNSKGEVAFVQFPTSWVTRGFVRRLLHELDRQDHVQLHLIKPGA